MAEIDASVKTLLSTLSSGTAVEQDAALSSLASLSGNDTSAAKYLASKDVRKKVLAICASCCTGGLRSFPSATRSILQLILNLAEASNAFVRSLDLDLGVRPVLAFLKRTQSDEVTLRACELLLLVQSSISLVPGNLPSQTNAKGGKFGLSMRLEGGIDVISSLCINASIDQLSLMVAAVRLLDASCEGSDNNVRVVLKRGVVRAVIAFLRIRAATRFVCQPLLKFLATVCGVAGAKAFGSGLSLSVSSITSTPAPQKVLTEGEYATCSTLELFVAILKRHGEDADTSLAALSLIGALADDPSIASTLCSSGAFAVGWTAAGRHARNSPAVLRQATSTMWRLLSGLVSFASVTPSLEASSSSTENLMITATAGAGNASSGPSVRTARSSSVPKVVLSPPTPLGYSPMRPSSNRDGVSKLVHNHLLLTISSLPAVLDPACCGKCNQPSAGTIPSSSTSSSSSTSGSGSQCPHSLARWDGAPPATISLWPLPHRPSAASIGHVAGLLQFQSLPRWSAPYLPRPGFYPPLPPTVFLPFESTSIAATALATAESMAMAAHNQAEASSSSSLSSSSASLSAHSLLQINNSSVITFAFGSSMPIPASIAALKLMNNPVDDGSGSSLQSPQSAAAYRMQRPRSAIMRPLSARSISQPASSGLNLRGLPRSPRPIHDSSLNPTEAPLLSSLHVSQTALTNASAPPDVKLINPDSQDANESKPLVVAQPVLDKIPILSKSSSESTIVDHPILSPMSPTVALTTTTTTTSSSPSSLSSTPLSRQRLAGGGGGHVLKSPRLYESFSKSGPSFVNVRPGAVSFTLVGSTTGELSPSSTKLRSSGSGGWGAPGFVTDTDVDLPPASPAHQQSGWKESSSSPSRGRALLLSGISDPLIRSSLMRGSPRHRQTEASILASTSLDGSTSSIGVLSPRSIDSANLVRAASTDPVTSPGLRRLSAALVHSREDKPSVKVVQPEINSTPQGSDYNKDDDRVDKPPLHETSSTIAISADSNRLVVDVLVNDVSRPSTASSEDDESVSPLSSSLRVEEANTLLGTSRLITTTSSSASRTEPTLLEKLAISSAATAAATSVIGGGGGDAPRSKRKVDPQLVPASIAALSAPPQPVPGGIHGMAWEACRSWLSAPHWFPELQQIAGLLPEVACFRASMSVSTLSTSKSGESNGSVLVSPLGGVSLDVALSRLQFDCEDISSLARNSSRNVAAPLGRGKGRGAPQLSFAASKTGGVHPASSSPPMHQSLGSTSTPNYSSSFSAKEERTAAAVILAHYSHQVVQRISRRSKFRLEACVEAALDRNRALPSVPLESSGYSFTSNPEAAREAVSAISDAAGSSVASPSLLFSQKIRIPRVFISRSGMCSVRHFLIPHSSIPSVFHCAPPTANLILQSQHAPSTLTSGAEKRESRTASSLLSHPLADGYFLRRPIRPLSLTQISTERSRLHVGPLIELPEPMLVNTDEQRASVAAHLMLRGIARAGVAAGQLMTKRSNLIGGGATAATTTTAAATISSSIAEILQESSSSTQPSPLPSVISFASPLVYYRYSEKNCDLPALLTTVGGSASRNYPSNSTTSALSASLLPPSPPSSLETEPPADTLCLLSRCLYLPNELSRPLPIPDTHIGLAKPGLPPSLTESASPTSPSSSPPSAANSPGRGQSLEKTLSSILTTPGRGRSPDRGGNSHVASGAASVIIKSVAKLDTEMTNSTFTGSKIDDDDDDVDDDESSLLSFVQDVSVILDTITPSELLSQSNTMKPTCPVPLNGGDDDASGGTGNRDDDDGSDDDDNPTTSAAVTDAAISGSSISSNAAALARERDLAKRAASLAAATREAITPTDVARILIEAADDVDAMVIHQKSRAEGGRRETTNRRQAQGGGGGGSGSSPSTSVGGLGSPRASMLALVPALDFESRFECGNLCAAVRTGPFEYEITIDLDINTPGHTQWFFFRVKNMVAHDATLTTSDKSGSGTYQKQQLFPLPEPHLCVSDNTFSRSKRLPFSITDQKHADEIDPRASAARTVSPPCTYRFHMVNLEKGGSTFNDGMRPLVYFQTEPEVVQDVTNNKNELQKEDLHDQVNDEDDDELATAVDGSVPIDIGRLNVHTARSIPGAATQEASRVPTLPGNGWRRAGFDVSYYKSQYNRFKEKVSPPAMSPDGGDASQGLFIVSGGAPPPPPTSTDGRSSPAPVPQPQSSINLVPSPQYSQSWSVTFPANCHTAFFAYCFPYSYTDLRKDMSRWEDRATRASDASMRSESGEASQGVPIRENSPSSSFLNAADVDNLDKDLDSSLSEDAFSSPPVPFAKKKNAPILPVSVPEPLGTLFQCGVLHRSILCYTLSGNPVPLLTITDFTSSPAALALRPYIVLSARVHPGETNASWMMRGVIDLLTSSAPLAIELRRRVIFKIVPFLNPDGVINGNHRTNLAGFDLNRHWTSPDPNRAPTIWHLRALILAIQNRAAGQGVLATDGSNLDNSAPLSLFAPQPSSSAFASPKDALGDHHSSSISSATALSSTVSQHPQTVLSPTEDIAADALPVLAPSPQPCLLFCDFHGHSRRRNVFTFGCHEQAADGAIPLPGEAPETGSLSSQKCGPSPKLFPKLLASRIDTFVLKDCSWKVQKDKKNCARLAMWRDALLPASYTIEASFAGPDTGTRKGIHFSTRMYEDVGHAFCVALLDFLEGAGGSRTSAAINSLKR